jgi:hypothetical protein
VNGELQAYAASIRERLSQLNSAVADLEPELLNWRPPVDGANSAWVIATHTLGATRAWILGIACGRDTHRDRPGEFAAWGSDTSQLAAAIERTSNEVEAALLALEPSSLDRRLLPPRELWGETPVHELSVRDAIIRVIGHISIHMGHLHITHDLARQQR